MHEIAAPNVRNSSRDCHWQKEPPKGISPMQGCLRIGRAKCEGWQSQDFLARRLEVDLRGAGRSQAKDCVNVGVLVRQRLQHGHTLAGLAQLAALEPLTLELLGAVYCFLRRRSQVQVCIRVAAVWSSGPCQGEREATWPAWPNRAPKR